MPTIDLLHPEEDIPTATGGWLGCTHSVYPAEKWINNCY
jgi:hypothetical protein